MLGIHWFLTFSVHHPLKPNQFHTWCSFKNVMNLCPTKLIFPHINLYKSPFPGMNNSMAESSTLGNLLAFFLSLSSQIPIHRWPCTFSTREENHHVTQMFVFVRACVRPVCLSVISFIVRPFPATLERTHNTWGFADLIRVVKLEAPKTSGQKRGAVLRLYLFSPTTTHQVGSDLRAQLHDESPRWRGPKSWVFLRFVLSARCNLLSTFSSPLSDPRRLIDILYYSLLFPGRSSSVLFPCQQSLDGVWVLFYLHSPQWPPLSGAQTNQQQKKWEISIEINKRVENRMRKGKN